MKTLFLNPPIFFLVGVLSSCHHEEIGVVCADPIGSDLEVIEQRNDSQVLIEDKFYSIGYDFICFKEKVNDCFRFELDKDQPVIQAFYIPTDGHSYGSIVDVGKKTCLADVHEKPARGWAYSVPVFLNHGYVVKKADGSFGRFFIDSWEAGADGLKTKINIVRQYSF